MKMTEMESAKERDRRANEAAEMLPPGFTLSRPPAISFTMGDVQAYLDVMTPAYECRRCGSSLALSPSGTYTETSSNSAYDPVTSSIDTKEVSSTALCVHDDYYNIRSIFAQALKGILDTYSSSSRPPLFIRSDQLTGDWAKANAAALNYKRGNRSTRNGSGKRGAESWDDVAERMRYDRYDSYYGLGTDEARWYVLKPR